MKNKYITNFLKKYIKNKKNYSNIIKKIKIKFFLKKIKKIFMV